MKLVERLTEDYIQLVASDEPAPGGGSASALCGAQGIGLIAMVAKLTVGKAKFEKYHSLCKEVIKEADQLCSKLTQQIDIDTEAYGRISTSYKLPKETDIEKAARTQAITDATIYASQVPLETMKLGVEGLKCVQKLIGNYNTNCASDVGCGIYGLLSCVQGAWLNVLINVSGLTEEAGKELKAEGEVLIEEAKVLSDSLEHAVKLSI